MAWQAKKVPWELRFGTCHEKKALTSSLNPKELMMNQKETFLSEFVAEAAKTRKMLERVPFDHATWKPHEKSSTLAALAQHVANLPLWVSITLLQDELDFAKPMERSKPVESLEELLAFADQRHAAAKAVLEATTEEILDSDWTMRNGEQIFFTKPKKDVLREFVLNHTVHHRGQLSVYLRLLDVPVPGMYGPTADEK
jgi:uncharacterized damage-inducible protein DinB